MSKKQEKQLKELLDHVNAMLKHRFNTNFHYEVQTENNIKKFVKVYESNTEPEVYIDNVKVSELIPIITMIGAVLQDI